MTAYRRLRIPGATYFFTLALEDRTSTALTSRINTLRHAFFQTLAERPVHIDAIVILPDHLHAIWTLPEGDADYSTRWRLIKARFSATLPPGPRRASLRRKGERGLWQRRFWEHTIRDGADYDAHMRYCWGNPVKHGLAPRACDWPYSSIHRDIRHGRVDPDWAGQIPEGRFGE